MRRNNIIICSVADWNFSDKKEEKKSNGEIAENLFEDLNLSFSKKWIEHIATFQNEKLRPFKLSLILEADNKINHD